VWHTNWLVATGGGKENQSIHLKHVSESNSLEFSNVAICEVSLAIELLPPKQTLLD